jgi:CSLREA domain-containing protein
MRPAVARRLGALVVAVGLFGSLAAAPVLAASIVVNSLADTVANDGVCTLREAIIAANTDAVSGGAAGECTAGSGADVITFSVGGTIQLTGVVQPILSTDMSIIGGGAITVAGDPILRVFAITAGSVTLSGLTITSGAGPQGGAILNTGTLTVLNSTVSGNTASALGGGIYNNGGTLNVTNSTISGNSTAPGDGGGIYNTGVLSVTSSTISGNSASSGNGGGIHNEGGTVTVTSSTISGNTASQGGGGIGNFGTLSVTSSTITGNSANLGGAIAAFGSTSIASSTISANTASGDGGGVHANLGTLDITNSTISGNTTSTGSGGGIFETGAALTVTSSTISGNSANVTGGGIINSGGTLSVTGSTISGNSSGSSGGGIGTIGPATVTNSTISGNTASVLGGGLYNLGTLTLTNSTISANTANDHGGGILAGGTETLVNDIVAGNTAPVAPETFDVVETTTTSVIGVPGGKTLADILVPAGLANNGGPTKTIALALVAGNPAIDTGTAATCAASPVSALDQRGMARPAACDIGSYEAQGPTVAPHSALSVPPTSGAGAVVTYVAPAGTNEQGGVAPVACLPASGSTFPVGLTTATCTATDAVGHTGTGTFQVAVGTFIPTLCPCDTAVPPSGTSGMADLPFLLGGLGFIGLLGGLAARRRPARRVTPR